jgi:hypothetical protein
MSGFLFCGPIGPYFELFLRNYSVSLLNEKTTTYITLLAYDWVWAADL